MKPDYDVVVAGAGIVGASLALSLARLSPDKPLRIALVEAREPPPAQVYEGDEEAPFDTRVVALSEASRLLLEEFGVWETIKAARACPYTCMEVHDADGTGTVSFDAEAIDQADLGHIVENSLILQTLYTAIVDQQNIELLCPETVTAVNQGSADAGEIRTNNELLQLQLQGHTVLTRLLVAADGSRSALRDFCGFETRSWDYGQQAIVATLRCEHSHVGKAWQWFAPQGPLAFLPLQNHDGDSHYISIVWSQQHQRAEQLMALSDQAFCRELGLASESCLGALELVTSRRSYPLTQSHVIDYVKPRIALVGDAAHTIHPLAGQGVNLGLNDVRVLSEELGNCYAQGRDIGSTDVLRRYQRRRKPENLAAMAGMEGLKRLFERDELPFRLLRNWGMKQVDGLGPVKNQLIKRAMGIP
ncbi:MAG TPA: 2-octaprenyl-3-methyl-6-methoxy-1,4-benzoquinol hydroxylase [Porticoccaceae bacterium]|nr:2-octaprenyl-3-methyl-6-methoxy-1,4-benzoquinol hydroxylase [Porticoccaceae bacterium]HCO60023.1 2-octaprenyl-3-methyl-6-methoxy-1,4-benzoquinol hydroxylase [Porticoccaceae bacterium]